MYLKNLMFSKNVDINQRIKNCMIRSSNEVPVYYIGIQYIYGVIYLRMYSML